MKSTGKEELAMNMMQRLSDVETQYSEEIVAMKKKRGSELVILTHHYQRQEVVSLNDFVGDSLQLAKNARDAEGAKYIVFCGVRFMAEAAEVLRRKNQVVIHPDPMSGCPLADYAPADGAEMAWEEITDVVDKDDVMPLVYMNSSAALKAMVGRNGGSVCTSSNTARAFQWAMKKRRVVFFLPDENLGRNTALSLGISPEQIAVWDPTEDHGGLTRDQISSAKVILWKGYCHVHTHFSTKDIQRAREKFPGCRVVVHPECPPDVVDASDGSGSTAYIVKQAEQAPAGSTLVVGTEVNLVSRLASEYEDKKIVALSRSLCPNMFRISIRKLRDSVASLPNPDKDKVVSLSDEVKGEAVIALDRMLSI